MHATAFNYRFRILIGCVKSCCVGSIRLVCCSVLENFPSPPALEFNVVPLYSILSCEIVKLAFLYFTFLYRRGP